MTRDQLLITRDQLTVTAQVIRDVFTSDMIRHMHSMAGGDIILRVIVQDDIEGAGDKIANALWDNL